MKYKIEKLEEVSGRKASIYSIKMEGKEQTIFEQFLEDYCDEFQVEIEEIAAKVYNIGHKYGARNQFFKFNEGKAGDLVMALYDHPERKLRIYGIKYASTLIILGSGGHKSKAIRSLQENELLNETNTFMRKVSDDIFKRTREKEIWFSDGDLELLGNLEFTED